MDLSVLICTYNRAADLGRTLDGMRAVALPDTVKWEVVVVDNNSKDDTRQVVREHEGALPVRYVFEGRQGKSNALNSGLESIAAPLIVLADDDVDVAPNWISSYLEAARLFPDAAFFGGKVATRWEVEPPAWIRENVGWLKSFSRYDAGDSPLTLKDHRDLFIGANMAFRKRVFDLGHRFSPDFGPRGDSRTTAARHGGEEGELQERIMKEGMQGVYVPGSLVYHRERPYRMTRRYIRWYWRESGRERRQRDGIQGIGPFWFDVPRYLWRFFMRDVTRYLATRTAKSSETWLRAECDLAVTMGDMLECRAQRVAAKQRSKPN